MIILLLLFLFSSSLVAQKSDISNEPLWLLVLPDKISDEKDQELENEISDIVVDIAVESGRFEVFDRYSVQKLLDEYPPALDGSLPDSVVQAIGDEIECDESLIVNVLSFSQIGVPPEENEEEEDRSFIESIFDGIFSSDSDDYADNIESHLSVQFKNTNLINGEEIDKYVVSVSHTGGTKSESEEQTLKNFREVVFNEVRLLYELVSEITKVDGMDLEIRLGRNLGVTGSTYFEIIEPDRLISDSKNEISVPGRSVGLASVRSVSDTVNQSLLIRQWNAVEPGFYAYEFNKKIHGIQLYFLPKFPGDYMYIGGQFHFNPLGSWDLGGGLHYTSLIDSYNETDHGFGFGLFWSFRIFTFTALMVHAKLGTDLDIPFKEDDDGETVTTAVLSGTLGISSSFMITKISDIELNIGYRLSTKSNEWTYSKNEEEFDAYWQDAPPVLDLSGFYFTVGYKLLLF
jgi:hypothetical protein